MGTVVSIENYFRPDSSDYSQESIITMELRAGSSLHEQLDDAQTRSIASGGTGVQLVTGEGYCIAVVFPDSDLDALHADWLERSQMYRPDHGLGETAVRLVHSNPSLKPRATVKPHLEIIRNPTVSAV